MAFVHLNVHSDFSPLMGTATIKEYLAGALELGHTAIGFTELDTCRGHYEMQATLEGKIKPIFGAQFSLVPDMSKRGISKEEREKLLEGWPREQWHEANRVIDDLYGVSGRDAAPDRLTLWAMTDEGLHNLWRIAGAAAIDGFYYRPRVDLTCIVKHNAGLAVGTGNFDGAVGAAILAGRTRRAHEIVSTLYATFGNRLVFELQPHRLMQCAQVNQEFVSLRAKLAPEARLVATVGAFYLRAEHLKHHRMYASIGSHREPDDCGSPGDGYWFMGEDEVRRRFAKGHKALSAEIVDAAIAGTVELAEACNAKVKVDKINALVPSVDLPPGVDADTHLRALCERGWSGLRNIPAQVKRRAAKMSPDDGMGGAIVADVIEQDLIAEYRARLERELAALAEKKFSSYILVVAELYDFARGAGIYCGPGRGSGAGSLVNYLVGITAVDPLEHGLMFERFISPGRNDMPDVDMDFCKDRRGEVIAWLRKRYGGERVAQIATWQRLKGKAVFSEVCKKMGINDPACSAIGKAIDKLMKQRKAGDAGFTSTVFDVMRTEDFAKPFAEKYPDLVEHCRLLEGKMRHCGTHAAGVVACPIDLRDAAPLESADDDGKRVAMTAFDMNGVAAVSLLKLDALGLKTMTVIRIACDEISKKLGRPFGLKDLETMELEDERVTQAFTAGLMDGVFQFETPSARRACKGLRFSGFADVAAMNAINRPGTLGSGMDAEFVKRRNAGNEKRKTIYHEKVDAITADAAGVVVYQEHVIRILVELAGYDPSAADVLRRKISKSKGKEELEKDRPTFLAGIAKTTPDMSQEIAGKLFDQIVDFGRYSFNKSHAVAYAMIAWWCMWLKVYHPLEFWTAMLSCEKDKKKAAGHVRSAKRDGVEVLGPDVSSSKIALSIDRAAGAIRASLIDIDGVGEKAAAAIVAHQPYASIEDLAEKLLRGGRAKINKSAGLGLAKAGALDSLVTNRKQLVERFEEIWSSLKSGSGFTDDGSEDYDEDAKAQIAASVSPSAADPFGRLMEEHVKVSPVEMQVDDFLAEYEHLGMIWIRGILEPVKWGSVGEHEKKEPSEAEKKRMGYGRRTATGYVEDINGVKVRIKIDPDEVERYADVLGTNKHVDVLIAGSVGRKYMGHQAFKLRLLLPLRQLQDDLSAGTELARMPLEQRLALGDVPALACKLDEQQTKAASWDLNKLAQKCARLYAADGQDCGVTIVGTVGWIRTKIDKNDNEMAWIGIVGKNGAIETTCFARSWGPLSQKISIGDNVEAVLTYRGDGFLLDKCKTLAFRRRKA